MYQVIIGGGYCDCLGLTSIETGLCSAEANFEKAVNGSRFYKDAYNDLDTPINQDIYQELVDNGVDDLLAKHYGHLFIRDPLVVFRELLDVDDKKSSDHFEVCFIQRYQFVLYKDIRFLILLTLSSSPSLSEYPIYELANYAFQTTYSQLFDWMAR